jgi:hypothetical protein
MALIMWERFIKARPHLTQNIYIKGCLSLSEKLISSPSIDFSEQFKAERAVILALDGYLYQPSEIDYLDIMAETFALTDQEYQKYIELLYQTIEKPRQTIL